MDLDLNLDLDLDLVLDLNLDLDMKQSSEYVGHLVEALILVLAPKTCLKPVLLV